MRSIPGYNSFIVWNKPLDMKFVGVTDDSMSFKNIDIETEVEIPVSDHVGAFGAVRVYDVHKGVDLYAPIGTKVYAVEDGVVINVIHYTGPEANCGWWLPTMAVYVAGRSGVICYGEIQPYELRKVGSTVRTGDLIGTVKRVIKRDKGRPTSMLHFVLLKHGYMGVGVWEKNTPKPYGLLDPSPMLSMLVEKEK